MKKVAKQCTPNLGLSVMLLSGAEVAATSVPDKSMAIISKLAVSDIMCFGLI